MSRYNASEIESKWQKKWESSELYRIDLENNAKKYYSLVMFPYPSGDKLHIGHWYNFGPADSHARFMRMKGHNVLEPMGFDSFGLPAENYAIKHGVHPTKTTKKNIEYMTKQLKAMGAMYDWDKTLSTSSPDYYKWTQWMFLKLYEKGLAYKKKAPVNWCPSCQTVLANEQVQDGACERCKHEVEKKDLSQWFFKIRDYAEKLLDYSGLDWPEKTILMQKNWIGRSEGSDIVFDLDLVDDAKKQVTVYTTRIDTLFGCSYMVLAPEHPMVAEITTDDQKESIEQYIEKSKRISDIERSAEGREKTGVFTGSYAINPVNGRKVPVWIADYVLMHYGTGAVMAVPAHDERDFDFAKKYDLEIVPVITDKKGRSNDEMMKVLEKDGAFVEDGFLINSGEFDGMNSEDARKAITEFLKKDGAGDFRVNYKLRDWLISRQRYWGAPIPIVYCEKCGEVAVPEEDLPVLLPENVDFEPTGESPLKKNEEFKNVKCPKCGGDAEREVDTMDTFVCSSWYFLRYPSNKLDDRPFDKDITNEWLPVDMYIGGPEHACMHLLYARFFNMALHDMGYIDFKEPFKRLMHQGMITKDGAKMSKSKGNVVSPDEFVEKYGSDVFRMYLMFMGPFVDGGDWNDQGITGIARFLDRFWKVVGDEKAVEDKVELEKMLNKLIEKVTEDIEDFHYNTAIAALMEFVNFALKNGIDEDSKKVIVRLIAPMAPHFAEECYEILGGKYSVFDSGWPEYDENMVVDEKVTIGVQVNGKLRGEIQIDKDLDKSEAIKLAMENEKVAKHLGEGEIVKEIYVPGKIVGFVVK